MEYTYKGVLNQKSRKLLREFASSKYPGMTFKSVRSLYQIMTLEEWIENYNIENKKSNDSINKMPNRYVEFVKEYAIKNKLGWNCAVCEIKEKGLYKPIKTLSKSVVKAKEPENIIIKKKKNKVKEPENIIIKKKKNKVKVLNQNAMLNTEADKILQEIKHMIETRKYKMKPATFYIAKEEYQKDLYELISEYEELAEKNPDLLKDERYIESQDEIDFLELYNKKFNPKPTKN